jgi:ATP-binding protein involved in chromosome partitioning
MCKDFGVDFLGALPLTMAIREQADSGKPTVVADRTAKRRSTSKSPAKWQCKWLKKPRT